MPEATLGFIFGTSFLVGLSGAMSPGPLLVLDIREAAGRGFWAGPLIVLGHGLLEMLLVIALALGLSQVLDQRPLMATIGILGGLFLVWLGVQMVRRPAELPLAPAQDGRGSPAPPRGGLVLAGVLVSVSNPYWALWWATIGASYMVWSLRSGAVGLASFYGGHVLADLAWYSLVSFAVGSGRRLMNGALYRGVSIACGAFLVLLGLYFIGAAGAGLLG